MTSSREAEEKILKDRKEADKLRIEKSLKDIGSCLERLDISMHDGEPECQDADWDHILSECRTALQLAMTSLHKDWGFNFK